MRWERGGGRDTVHSDRSKADMPTASANPAKLTRFHSGFPAALLQAVSVWQ